MGSWTKTRSRVEERDGFKWHDARSIFRTPPLVEKRELQISNTREGELTSEDRFSVRFGYCIQFGERSLVGVEARSPFI